MNPDSAARLLETAFQLAELGRGSVEPNPRVGALALARGRVVGRGFHAEYGGPHAEIAALEDANKTGQKPDGLLVTLEPCSTAGKTPPCTEAIARAGIRWLGFGAVDPNPNHAGRGISRLRDHGVEVAHLQGDARFRAQNRPFLRALERSRPWVVAKWAMTLDGRTALSNGDSKWVSGEESRARVHRLRGRCEGVAVGVSTVLRDDPLLTCRDQLLLSKPPARVIFDSLLRTPVESRVAIDRSAPTWILTLATAPIDRRKALAKVGVQVIDVAPEAGSPASAPRLSLAAAMETLHSLGIRRLLVESGSELVGALRAARLVDQLLVFVAPKIAGAPAAPAAPAGAPEAPAMALAAALEEIHVERVGDDVLIGGFLGLEEGA
jgi:diaminohydroxyphosphoribosylaminopyrimidine deaminase/5-amino-6-(5-phosphoribosylamino)uracil reductase